MNLSECLKAAEKRLKETGIENAGFDARVLAAHALETDRARLVAEPDRLLTERERHHIDVLIECRARREPVARILREREFWSLTFGLNEATLVPRPESETLIDAALSVFAKRRAEPLRILDLGTGSGCLLLTLLYEFKNASGVGIDLAPRAVAQAQENAKRLGLTARAEFMAGNWAENIAERFDLVISNPPYIAPEEIPHLMPEVRDYDPRLALDGGKYGLATYHALAPKLPELLKPHGTAIFEIGEGQAASVRLLFQKADFTKIDVRKDLHGIERCVIAS